MDGAYVYLSLSLIVAGLLWLVLHRFVVRTNLSKVILFGFLWAASAVALAAAAGFGERVRVRGVHEKQTQVVMERVQAAGGWEELRRECESLLAAHACDSFFLGPSMTNFWMLGNSNTMHSGNEKDRNLPLPVLAKLQPREMSINVASDGPAVVRLNLFGAGRRGPWLYVLCGSGSAGFRVRSGFDGVSDYRQLADAVYLIWR
jgi:hypothetical protein